MAAEIAVAPEVEEDLSEAYEWYEQRRSTLGDEFLSCVDACVQGIARNPEMYAVVYEQYRRALIRRFPYVIFYEYADGTVTIHAVFHTSRDPHKWRERLDRK